MRKILLLTFIMVILSSDAGCSTRTHSVTTETREDPETAVVEKKQVTTTTENRDESSGVLSSSVDVVGEVLAWPFRAVGGLLRGIF